MTSVNVCGRERGRREAGFFGGVREVPTDRGERRILHEGGGGVRGGFAGFVLLGEGEREVVAGDGVCGIFFEEVAPGFFGGGELAGGVGGRGI